MVERIGRARSVEYVIHYVQKRREILVHLGKYWVATIRRSEGDTMYRYPHYVGHINLPGMVGPAVREANEHLAKVEVAAKLREWLSGLSAATTSEVERPAPVAKAGRVSRTRPAPSLPVTRVRSRIR